MQNAKFRCVFVLEDKAVMVDKRRLFAALLQFHKPGAFDILLATKQK